MQDDMITCMDLIVNSMYPQTLYASTKFRQTCNELLQKINELSINIKNEDENVPQSSMTSFHYVPGDLHESCTEQKQPMTFDILYGTRSQIVEMRFVTNFKQCLSIYLEHSKFDHSIGLLVMSRLPACLKHGALFCFIAHDSSTLPGNVIFRRIQQILFSNSICNLQFRFCNFDHLVFEFESFLVTTLNYSYVLDVFIDRILEVRALFPLQSWHLVGAQFMHLAETSILTNHDFLYDFCLLPLDDLTIKYKIPSLQTQLIRFGKMTRSNYKITYCCGHFCTLSSAKEWFSTNFDCIFCGATSIYAINIHE